MLHSLEQQKYMKWHLRVSTVMHMDSILFGSSGCNDIPNFITRAQRPLSCKHQKFKITNLISLLGVLIQTPTRICSYTRIFFCYIACTFLNLNGTKKACQSVFDNVQNTFVFHLVQKYRNTVKHIPAQSEISYTCITEGDILILEASCSYGA